MSLRMRLSCLSLEDRANPSGPDLIDPYSGLTLSSPQDPTDPALTTTTTTDTSGSDTGTTDTGAIDLTTTDPSTTDGTTTDTSSDTYNSIYKANTLDLIYVGTTP